jgi:hypothetical protein
MGKRLHVEMKIKSGLGHELDVQDLKDLVALAEEELEKDNSAEILLRWDDRETEFCLYSVRLETDEEFKDRTDREAELVAHMRSMQHKIYRAFMANGTINP